MKKLVIISFLFIIPILGISQSSIVGQKTIMQPEKYLTPTENVSLSKTDGAIFGFPWVVFSDHADNYTIEELYSTSKYKKLSFLEKFYVIEENDTYIHLIKDTEISINGIFSSQAENYGYIKKEEMLLWRNCIKSNETNFNKKAIIIYTYDSTERKQIKKKKNNTNTFFGNHQLTIKLEREFEKYDFFYIYKIIDEAVLLGRNSRIPTGADISNYIVGWINRNRITFWDHKMALEPNWKEDAAKERKFKEIKTTVLADAPSARKFGKGEAVRKRFILWDEDTYSERKIGEWMRFPILDINREKNYYHVGVIGEINSESYFHFDAYAPIHIKGLKEPPFQRVSLLSRLELGSLITVLDKLNTVKFSGNRRKKLVETWTEVLQVYLGEINEEEILEMDIAEINKKIFGLPGTSDLLRDVKLKYLNDPSVVSENKIRHYIMKIDMKLKKLTKIFNSLNYKYSFNSNDETYFWIPESDIP